MTNVTFSVDKTLHEKMRSHPEIKWSEILRHAIIDYMNKIEGQTRMTMKEFKEQLSEDTLKKLDQLDLEGEISFNQRVKAEEEKDMKIRLDLEGGS